MATSAETERVKREIEKCRWVIAQNASNPLVVARWQARLDELLGVERDVAYWLSQASVCLAKAQACLERDVVPLVPDPGEDH